MTYQVKKLVSKFAFQVHNLRRYAGGLRDAVGAGAAGAVAVGAVHAD
jgi:hypothetical protein